MRELENTPQIVELLHRIATIGADAAGEKALAGQATELALDVLGFAYGSVAVGGRAARIEILVNRGVPLAYLQFLKEQYMNLPGAKIIATGEPHVVPDTYADPAYAPLIETYKEVGIRAMAVFPLRQVMRRPHVVAPDAQVSADFFGILGAYHPEPLSPNPLRVALTRTLAAHLQSLLAGLHVQGSLELVGSSDDFLYDADGLLAQAGTLVIGRDDDTGQVTGTTLADVTTTQQYNGFGAVELLQASHGTVGELYSEEILERDAMGRITVREETVEGVTTRYNYDYWEMGRLERVSTGTPGVDEVCVAEYTYDANGNRLSTACGDSTPTAAYDAQDRLNASPGASYTYTLDGSLETKTDAGGVTATVYDAFGNLLTVVLPDATQIDYAVDARGRRIGKYVNGNSTKPRANKRRKAAH